VTDIVTTRRVSGVDYRDPESGCIVVLDPVDSKLVVSSPIRRSSTSMHTLRMKRLVEKGSEQQNDKPQEMLIVAKEYNISVFHYDHFRDYLHGHLRLRTSSERNSKKRKAEDEIPYPFTKKFKDHCEENKLETTNIRTPLSMFKKKIKRDIPLTTSPSKLMVIQELKTFQNPYILVEDASESNLEPFSKEFPKNSNNPNGFPVINYLNTTSSPFLDLDSLTSVRVSGDTELEDKTDGYCKICKVRFNDYLEHIKSNLHVSQIEQVSTFNEIDSLLCLLSQRRKNNGEKCHTNPNKTNSQPSGDGFNLK